ncbi:hypothetical protein BDW69DRAFT_101358 [Aspergillus filifer]
MPRVPYFFFANKLLRNVDTEMGSSEAQRRKDRLSRNSRAYRERQRQRKRYEHTLVALSNLSIENLLTRLEQRTVTYLQWGFNFDNELGPRRCDFIEKSREEICKAIEDVESRFRFKILEQLRASGLNPNPEDELDALLNQEANRMCSEIRHSECI